MIFQAEYAFPSLLKALGGLPGASRCTACVSQVSPGMKLCGCYRCPGELWRYITHSSSKGGKIEISSQLHQDLSSVLEIKTWQHLNSEKRVLL